MLWTSGQLILQTESGIETGFSWHVTRLNHLYCEPNPCFSSWPHVPDILFRKVVITNLDVNGTNCKLQYFCAKFTQKVYRSLYFNMKEKTSRYYVQSKIHSTITRLRVNLHQASASTLRQLCDDGSDTVLIKNNGVSQKWVVTLILGDSIVFDENRILSIIAELSLQRWHWRLV